jgi:hypothetical protein
VSAISTVRAARPRRLHRVEDDGGGIGSRRLGDHGHLVAASPDLQLLDRRGPERVAGGEHHLETAVDAAFRELADRGRLAGAVDTDDEYHERLAFLDLERPRAGRQDRQHRLAQRAQQCVEIGELVAGDLPAQPVQQLPGRLDADIRTDQSRLELIEHAVVDAATRQQVREVIGQPRVATIEPRPHARDQAGTRLGLRGGRARLGLWLRLEAE